MSLAEESAEFLRQLEVGRRLVNELADFLDAADPRVAMPLLNEWSERMRAAAERREAVG